MTRALRIIVVAALTWGAIFGTDLAAQLRIRIGTVHIIRGTSVSGGGGGGGSTALTSLPLLTMSNILTSGCVTSVAACTTPGGARVPQTSSNGEWFDNAPQAISYDAVSGRMYVNNYTSSMGEISLPVMVNANTLTGLNTAAYYQGWMDPSEGQKLTEADAGLSGGDPRTSLFGVLVAPDRIYGTYANFYDASTTQRKSHFSRPRTLTVSSDVKGIDQFWDGAEATGATLPAYVRFVNGYLFRVPPAIQSLFGGYTMGSGQCCQSVVSNGSFGPAAGLFDPAKIGSGGVEPHTWKPLVFYDSTHTTLGAWDEPNPDYPACSPACDRRRGLQNTYFGYTTSVRAAVIIDGTRTMAFFGRQGTGTPCYGSGTSDPALHLTTAPDGSLYCYDPSSSSKANHQYPYRYFIWLYNLEHMLEAFNGTRSPWLVVPYGGGEFFFPIQPNQTNSEALVQIGGADYDPATNSLYLVQLNVDAGARGVIWKFPVTVP